MAVAGLALLGVGALVVALLVLLDRLDRTPLERALAVAPPASRVSFTDWTAVRAAVDADLGDTPDREAVEEMVDAAYDRDLAAVSAVDEAAGAMQQLFGFGPGTAQWEVYAQSTEGAALALRPPDGTDYDVLGDNLRSAGFTAPDGGDDGDEGGVWRGGIDLVADLDPTLTPVVQYVVLLPDEGLVLASDEADYAERAAAVATGEEEPVGDADGVADLAARMEGALNTVMWVDDFACTDLAMARADDEARAAAEARVAELGGVSPLSGLALGLVEGGRLRVVEHFADADQAERDLEVRAELAVGEAYGRGGAFTDDLELVRSRTVDADVVLDFEPVRPDGFPLSSLYDGPLVLATC